MNRKSTNLDFPRPKNLRSLLGTLIFYWRYRFYATKYNNIVRRALFTKRLVFGPFVGELGHLLAHNLPLLFYLYQQNVQITFIGFERFQPFLKDSNGNPIYTEFCSLRDFSSETKIKCNSPSFIPEDIGELLEKLKRDYKLKKLPVLWLDNESAYWYFYRRWLLNSPYRAVEKYNFLSRKESNKTVSIFVRNKVPDSQEKLRANGPLWDYDLLVNNLLGIFDEVNLIGVPNDSLKEINTKNSKVKWKVGLNNEEMLSIVANSDVVITPHSGAMYLAAFVDTPFVVIYKGINSYEEIGDINSTLTFLKALNFQKELIFAFSNEDLIEKIKPIYEKT